jgi:acyl carrier protein
MTRTDIQSAVSAELHRIAPEIAIDDIDRRADLREEFDIDSMDFLTLVTALSKRFCIDMPEADYSRMRSFDALIDYIESKAH